MGLFNIFKRLSKEKKPSIEQLYNEGNYEELIKLKSDDAIELQMIGKAYHELGRVDDAIGVTRRAFLFASESQKDDIRINLAKYCYINGRYESAIEYSQEVRSFKQGYLRQDLDFTLDLIIGSSYYHLNKYKIAISAYKKAPLTSKKSSKSLLDIRYHAALAYKADGNIKMAKKMLDIVLSNDINHIESKELYKLLNANESDRDS